MKINPEEKISIDSLFLKMALHNDEASFKELFHLFFSPLCVFAFRYIQDKETCEDIVQDTFFKIWKNRKNIDIKTSTRNFLITSVRNNCIDFLRKKDLEHSYRLHQERMMDPELMSIENLYSLEELKSLIESALEKLPSNIRDVFEMNRFEGLTYAEIAQKNDISVKSVEAYMSKALKILRVELSDYLTIAFVLLFFYQ